MAPGTNFLRHQVRGTGCKMTAGKDHQQDDQGTGHWFSIASGNEQERSWDRTIEYISTNYGSLRAYGWCVLSDYRRTTRRFGEQHKMFTTQHQFYFLCQRVGSSTKFCPMYTDNRSVDYKEPVETIMLTEKRGD